MLSRMRIMGTLLVVIALAGCSASPQREVPVDESPVAEAPADARTVVEWEDYDASVTVRIDDLQSAADCAGLQGEFDTADANNAATLDRTGHSNLNLMTYIDEALRLAGCYGG
jgi:hypothetical protein